MREIKFRAWDKKFENMMNCKHVAVMNSRIIMNKQKTFNEFPQDMGDFVGMNGTYILSDDCIIMQFTGLKDKNGKEIYEGDILKNLDSNIPSTVIISWRNHNASFGTNGWDLPFNLEKIYEVIGNIYENKNLLGEDGQ